MLNLKVFVNFNMLRYSDIEVISDGSVYLVFYYAVLLAGPH